MSYVLGEIAPNGMIYAVDTQDDEQPVIHLETRLPLQGQPTFATLDEAKRELRLRGEQFIALSFTESGTVIAIWVKKRYKSLVTQRLEIWKGCYGGWPINLFQDTKKSSLEALVAEAK